MSMNGCARTKIELLIKIYHDGIFTPELAKLKEGMIVSVPDIFRGFIGAIGAKQSSGRS